MTLARVETYSQPIAGQWREREDEQGLGFDAMLSDEVIKWVHANYRVNKPLAKKRLTVKYHPNRNNGLDEHELAMA